MKHRSDDDLWTRLREIFLTKFLSLWNLRDNAARKSPIVALSDGLDSLTQILYVVTTALFASTMVIGVFFRYVLNASLSWSDEVACILFVWATFFSIATAYLHDQHITLDVIRDKLSPSTRDWIDPLAEGLSGAFILCLLFSGYHSLNVAARGVTDALRLPLTVSFICIPIASVFMLIHWLRRNVAQGNWISFSFKLLVMVGYFWMVYLPLGSHVHLQGALRNSLLLLNFVIPLFIGVPVAFSIGLLSAFYIAVAGDIPFTTNTLQMYFGINILMLMAIPLLILSGNLMHGAGMAAKVVDFAQILAGRVRGGLGAADILASLIFGDISGSAVSDTAAIGGLMIPEMKKRGYRADFCAALQGAAGTLGMMAPLSITILLYCAACNQSVSRLAAASILPALLVAFSFIVVVLVHAYRNSYAKEYVPFNEYLKRTLRAIPALFAIVLLAAGILGGAFTPAEVGTILLFYILILMVFLYRNAKPREIYKAVINSGYISGMTMFLCGTSALLGFVLSRDNMSDLVIQTISNMTSNKYMIIFMVSMVFIVLGMVLEAAPMIYGILPTFMPVLLKAGVDPVLWGVLFMINMGLGMIIPPVALNLFVSTRIAQVKYEQAVLASVPFITIMFLDMVIVVVFPHIPLLLPNLLFNYPIR